jgi:hypothetical protein
MCQLNKKKNFSSCCRWVHKLIDGLLANDRDKIRILVILHSVSDTMISMRAATMLQYNKCRALQITTRAMSSINSAGVDTSADKISLVQGASRGNTVDQMCILINAQSFHLHFPTHLFLCPPPPLPLPPPPCYLIFHSTPCRSWFRICSPTTSPSWICSSHM